MGDFYKAVFNQEIKERFLNEIDISQYPNRWWERVFEKSSMFEEKYNKDLLEFTAAEITEFYKFIDGSLETLIVMNLNLIKYGDWGLNNNMIMDGQNHFSEFDNELLNRCVSQISLRKSIISLDDLRSLSNQFPNAQDKFLFWALFEGIKGKEYSDLTSLRMEDLNENACTATLASGKIVNVMREFINICYQADKEEEYKSFDGTSHPKKCIDMGFIWKDKQIVTVHKDKSIYNTIVRNIANLGLSKFLSGNSIFQSGMIYYLNQRALENDTTVKKLFEHPEDIQDILEKYNFNKSLTSRFLLKYGEILI